MKRNLFTVFMLAVTTFLLAAGFAYEVAAQEAVLPDAEFRTWRDPNTERLYWNKHLPVYLYLSPNPNGADAHLLKSESMPRYATPFYFDTEGRNFMRTRWAVDPDTKKAIVPQKEVLWEVYADGLAPQTHIKFQDEKGVMTTKRYLGVGSKFSLHASDAVSGVEVIYYSLNGEGFQKYEGTINLTKEGRNEVRYCAEDRVGNREELHFFWVDMDVTAPTTQSEIMGVVLGKDNTVTPQTQIRLEARDALSGVRSTRYRIDSGRWQEYSAQARITMKQLADGNHLLEFYSTDLLGNTEEIQKVSFYLDAIPPITISDILGDKFLVGDKLYFSSRTKMKITAVDNH
ncbi:MAG: OmpL47-type beta-barrel domain-containing protein, partial [Bacteroides sp.]